MSTVSRLPPLNSLVVFEAAYRHKNFTHAARELHFSQATVSRRVAELERDLGVQLFERRRHAVIPTSAAEMLITSVRLAFDELKTTGGALRRRGQNLTKFTIFSDLSLTTTLIAPIVGEFKRAHPDLEISIHSSFDPIEAGHDRFDFGLLYGRGDPPANLIVEPLADDDVFPVCAPGFADSKSDGICRSDLSSLPLLHVDYGDPAWVDWPRFLEVVGVEPSVVEDSMVFSSYQASLDVAEQGEGIALGWERTVQPRIASGRLVRCTDAVLPDHGAIRAYRPREAGDQHAATAFLALLRSSVAPKVDQLS